MSKFGKAKVSMGYQAEGEFVKVAPIPVDQFAIEGSGVSNLEYSRHYCSMYKL